jgi:hypothetical protein
LIITATSGLYERCNFQPFHELSEEDQIQLQWMWKLGMEFEALNTRYLSLGWHPLSRDIFNHDDLHEVFDHIRVRPVRKV